MYCGVSPHARALLIWPSPQPVARVDRARENGMAAANHDGAPDGGACHFMWHGYYWLCPHQPARAPIPARRGRLVARPTWHAPCCYPGERAARSSALHGTSTSTPPAAQADGVDVFCLRFLQQGRAAWNKRAAQAFRCTNAWRWWRRWACRSLRCWGCCRTSQATSTWL